MSAIKAHRHFDAEPWEAMLEQQSVEVDDGVVSVAKPVALEEISRLGGKPNVIALGPIADGRDAHQWFPINYGI